MVYYFIQMYSLQKLLLNYKLNTFTCLEQTLMLISVQLGSMYKK
jgi:hypothetical protein